MIQLTNSSAQTVAPGAAVTFNTVELKSGNCECFNKLVPTSVKLRAAGTYEVEFEGNVASATAGAPVQLAIALGGSPLPSTVRVSTPSAANAFNPLPVGTLLRVCCCDLDRVTVVNTGTTPVLLSANMNLRIKRLA